MRTSPPPLRRRSLRTGARPSPYPVERRSIQQLSLREVGLGYMTVGILSGMALFPLVGLVVGWYYQNQAHRETRAFGRALFWFAVILHMVYFCLICPLLAYAAFLQLTATG